MEQATARRCRGRASTGAESTSVFLKLECGSTANLRRELELKYGYLQVNVEGLEAAGWREICWEKKLR